MALAPHYNIKQIATGCLYLLTNKATLHFPGSDRSKPSREVVVDMATMGPYRSSDRTYFPFKLGWAVWHEAIVPVLESKDVQVIVVDNPSLRVHQNKILISLELYDELVRKIEAYLLDSLVAHGYLPSIFAPLPEPVEEPDASCPVPSQVVWNPSAPPGTPGGPPNPDGTPVVDDDTTHPDGTPKQEYPIVDPDLSPSSC